MNKLSILLISIFVLTVSSCQDVLDTTPKGVLAEGVLSATSVDKLVAAGYQTLGGHFAGNDEAFAGPASNWVNDVRTDDCYKGGGGITDRTDIHQLETCTFDADNTSVKYKWQNYMWAIARINLAIREIQNLTDAKYPKNIRLGEMKLLRGYFHLELLQCFKQIPYLHEDDDPVKTGNANLTTEQLYAEIETDFKFAFDNLPLSQEDVGRANKYAAAAFLSRLYMDTKQWSKAITNADFIITSNKYGLLNEFEDLSTIEQENGRESVFTIQYSTANTFANHDWANLLNVTSSPGIANGGYANGDDFYHGSQNLVNAFRTDVNGLPLFDTFNNEVVFDGSYSGSLDPRVDFTVGRLGIPWKGSAIYTTTWVRSPDYAPGFSGKKHVVSPSYSGIHNSFPWAASGLNFMLVRYAEVLLWKAEALIELNQDMNTARDLINSVRGRAMNSTYVQKLDGSGPAANYKISTYPASGWTQDYARKAVRFERRLELAMEGKRMPDLNRWGIAAKTINDYFATEKERVPWLKTANFVANKHEYLPIPQRELDLIPGLYKQNNGY